MRSGRGSVAAVVAALVAIGSGTASSGAARRLDSLDAQAVTIRNRTPVYVGLAPTRRGRGRPTPRRRKLGMPRQSRARRARIRAARKSK